MAFSVDNVDFKILDNISFSVKKSEILKRLNMKLERNLLYNLFSFHFFISIIIFLICVINKGT